MEDSAWRCMQQAAHHVLQSVCLGREEGEGENRNQFLYNTTEVLAVIDMWAPRYIGPHVRDSVPYSTAEEIYLENRANGPSILEIQVVLVVTIALVLNPL